MKKIIATLCFVFTGYLLHAQQIVTDRPDQTESSSTLEKGDLQIEAGVLFFESKDYDFKSFAGPSTLFRVGILKGFELRLMTQYEDLDFEENTSNNVSGWSDLQIGTKVQLLQNGGDTEIAFLTHFVLPTANDALSNNEVGVINKLSIGHDLGAHVGLGYNVGYDYMGGVHQLTYSLALGLSLSDNIGFFIEPYGSHAEGGSFESNFDTGITYLINNNFQLDASYGFGLNHNMNFLSFGFSWKLPELLKSSD